MNYYELPCPVIASVCESRLPIYHDSQATKTLFLFLFCLSWRASWFSIFLPISCSPGFPEFFQVLPQFRSIKALFYCRFIHFRYLLSNSTRAVYPRLLTEPSNNCLIIGFVYVSPVPPSYLSNSLHVESDSRVVLISFRPSNQIRTWFQGLNISYCL